MSLLILFMLSIRCDFAVKSHKPVDAHQRLLLKHCEQSDQTHEIGKVLKCILIRGWLTFCWQLMPFCKQQNAALPCLE